MTMKTGIWAITVAALTAIVVPQGAIAGGVQYSTQSSGAASGQTAPQTCDPKYWESMSAKAWMEAEREIIQNKNLIYKPDSVLEYVCFDKFMQHTAKYVGDLFTHTTYFGQEIIKRGTQYSMEEALTKAVTNSYKKYVKGNFDHKFLGERARYMNNVVSKPEIKDAKEMQDYDCAIMANIWQGAKCENFIHDKEAELDGFFPFDKLDGDKSIEGYKDMDDPRKFPTQCSKPSGDWSWDKTIPIATNEEDKQYDFQKPNEKTYEKIRPKLEPGECGEAVKTGVKVVTDASATGGYDDGVCTNPGCSYQEGGSCQ